MPVVRPEFGPTLPELLGPRLRALPRVGQAAVALLALIVVAVAVYAYATRGSGALQRTVVVRAPVAFNFIYRAPFAKQTPRAGELARVGGRGQSFSVRPLRLAPYRGDSSGVLPVLATHLATRMAKTYDDFLVRQEGRANVNRQQGYELLFQFRRGGKLAYGRRMLLMTAPTGREGADLLMLAPRTPAIPRFDAVGRNGGLKVALRSFRFGTQRP